MSQGISPCVTNPAIPNPIVTSAADEHHDDRGSPPPQPSSTSGPTLGIAHRADPPRSALRFQVEVIERLTHCCDSALRLWMTAAAMTDRTAVNLAERLGGPVEGDGRTNRYPDAMSGVIVDMLSPCEEQQSL